MELQQILDVLKDVTKHDYVNTKDYIYQLMFTRPSFKQEEKEQFKKILSHVSSENYDKSETSLTLEFIDRINELKAFW